MGAALGAKIARPNQDVIFTTGDGYFMFGTPLVALWAVSRTAGLPIGPGAWMPEPVQTLDVSATVLELVLVAGALVLVRRRRLGSV